MIRHLANALLSALIAPPCAVCRRVLDHPLDGAVCPDCWDTIAPASTSAFTVGPSVARGCAIGAYEGTLREIIHALKYDRRRSVAPRLADLMATHGREVLDGADLIVPVPLHRKRQRERGFNQAEDLARGLGLPVLRALSRVKHTQPQVDLPAPARHSNVREAFALAGDSTIRGTFAMAGHSTIRGVIAMAGHSKIRGTSAIAGHSMIRGTFDEGPGWRGPQRGGRDGVPFSPAVAGNVIVLVDDVTTTGATLEACARVLKAAGVPEVRALTAARVVTARR